MQRGADWVVFDHLWSDPAFLKVIFPSMPVAAPPEVIGFERAVRAGFTPVVRHGQYELLRRSPDASAALCGPVPAGGAR